MGEDEASTALDVELLAAAAMIATSDARGRSADAWTPTKTADEFLALPHEQAWATDRADVARPAPQPFSGGNPGRGRQGAERAVGGAVLDPRAGGAALRARRAGRPAAGIRAGPFVTVRAAGLAITAAAAGTPGRGADLDRHGGHRARSGRLRRADHGRPRGAARGHRRGVSGPGSRVARAGGHRAHPGGPDDRRARPAGAGTGGQARPGRRRGVGRQRHRIPGHPADHQACAGRGRVHRGPARAVHPAFGHRCAAGPHLPDRRHRPAVRGVAGRPGRYVCAQRRPGVDRPGHRRGSAGRDHPAPARSDGGDHRCVPSTT